MKKVLCILLVLVFASISNALMSISVNGQTNVEQIVLQPSQEIVIDITGDGRPTPDSLWLIGLAGPGTMTGGQLVSPWGTGDKAQSELSRYTKGPGNEFIFQDFINTVPGYETANIAYFVVLTDSADPFDPIAGKIVDGIIFHCDGPGDVVIKLASSDLGVLQDVLVIHQVPEPATIALLGLGGLLLRRRK